MVSFPTSEPNRVERGELMLLRRIVRGDARTAGLAKVLPLLQSAHRRELHTEPHWSKEALVRHPEPRELIRSMDERRSLTADIYENRVVRKTIEAVEERLRTLEADGSHEVALEATSLLRALEGGRRRASFLDDVGALERTGTPSATLTQDPLYRRIMSIRAELAG